MIIKQLNLIFANSLRRIATFTPSLYNAPLAKNGYQKNITKIKIFI